MYKLRMVEYALAFERNFLRVHINKQILRLLCMTRLTLAVNLRITLVFKNMLQRINFTYCYCCCLFECLRSMHFFRTLIF